MSGLHINQEQVEAFIREAVVEQVAGQLPLIRAEIIEQMMWLPEETCIALLALGDRHQPRRAFRDKMRAHGIEPSKVFGLYKWSEIEHLLEHGVKRPPAYRFPFTGRMLRPKEKAA